MTIKETARQAARQAHPNGLINLALVDAMADAVSVAVLWKVRQHADEPAETINVSYVDDMLAEFIPAPDGQGQNLDPVQDKAGPLSSAPVAPQPVEPLIISGSSNRQTLRNCKPVTPEPPPEHDPDCPICKAGFPPDQPKLPTSEARPTEPVCMYRGCEVPPEPGKKFCAFHPFILDPTLYRGEARPTTEDAPPDEDMSHHDPRPVTKAETANQLEAAYQRVSYGMPVTIPETLVWNILGHLRSFPVGSHISASSERPEVAMAKRRLLATLSPCSDAYLSELHASIDALILAVQSSARTPTTPICTNCGSVRLGYDPGDVPGQGVDYCNACGQAQIPESFYRIRDLESKLSSAEGEIARRSQELEKRDTSAQAVVSITMYREAVGRAEAALRAIQDAQATEKEPAT